MFSLHQEKAVSQILLQAMRECKTFSSPKCLAFYKNKDVFPDIFSEVLEEFPQKQLTNVELHM